MRVRLTTSLPWCGYEYHDGDEIELPDAVAAAYVATRQAEYIEPPIETASLRTQPAKGKYDGRTKTTRASV